MSPYFKFTNNYIPICSKVPGLRHGRKWNFNKFRPMEQDPSKDLIAKQKSGRRYASKAFTQFKKPIELSGGYEMYTADPQDARKKDYEKRKKKRAKANKSGRRSRILG